MFFVLKNGLSLGAFQTHFFYLDELYIKLDKKLIVKADKITLFEDQNQTSEFSSKAVFETIEKLKYIYVFFQEIDIKEFDVNGQKLRLSFKDDSFFVQNDDFFLALALNTEQGLIHAQIKDFQLQDFNATTQADIYINTEDESYTLNGGIRSDMLDLNVSMFYDGTRAKFKLSDVNASNMKAILKQVNKFVSTPKELDEWLGEKIQAQIYHIDTFETGLVFRKKGISLEQMQGNGYLQKVQVKLGKNVKSILLPRVDLKFKNQRLDFYFKQASYKNYDLSQSKIYLYNLLGANKGLYLQIKSNDLLLDKDVRDIFKLFDVNIPLLTLSGKLKSDFVADIPLAHSSKAKFKAEFDLEDIQLDLADFFVKKGRVNLKDYQLSLENLDVNNSFLQADVNASIDIEARNGVFQSQLKRFYFDTLVDLRDENLSLNLDFNNENNISLSVPKFDLMMNFSQGIELKSSRLDLFQAHSTLMQNLGIKSAKNFTLKSADFINFEVGLDRVSFKDFLLKNDLSPYNEDSFKILVKPNHIQVRSLSDFIDVNIRGKNIQAKLKDLVYILEDTKAFSTDPHLAYNVTLEASGVGIWLKKFNKYLIFDTLNAKLFDSNLRAFAKKQETGFSLIKDEKGIDFRIVKANDSIINNFFQSRIFENGEFSMLAQGKDFDNLQGRIVMEKTYIRELKFYNQLISFIDTIPSLLLFKGLTFNEKGLHVGKGVTLFEKRGQILHIKGLNFDGDSVDILGFGGINLDTNTLQLELELRSLKSASEVISKVPIINQVVLGKDRVISTQILIDGKLDNPRFKTQIIKEAIKLPFDLIKNIIELPSTLFE